MGGIWCRMDRQVVRQCLQVCLRTHKPQSPPALGMFRVLTPCTDPSHPPPLLLLHPLFVPQQKAAFMAAERAKSRPGGLRHLASNTLRDLIDWRRLRGVRHHFDGLVWMLQVGRGRAEWFRVYPPAGREG